MTIRPSTLGALILFLGLLQPLTTKSAAILPPEAYDDAVAALVEAEVVDSVVNSRVFDFVNRAEALKLIMHSRETYAKQVEDFQKKLPLLPLFPDVKQTAWYAPAIEVAFKNKLIKGYPDGFFRPEAGVSVAEAVVMLARAYGEPVNTIIEYRTSSDLRNAQNSWFTDAVSVMITRDAVMQGSQLRLDDLMTRGQLFDMLYRMRIAHGQGVRIVEQTSTQGTNQNNTATPEEGEIVRELTASESLHVSSKDFALAIPSIGIADLSIIHPADTTTQKGVLAPLKDGVGHLFSYPGEGGKVVVYGHSSGYPWDLSQYTKIFRTINKVAIGDKMYVTHKGKLYVYSVTQKLTIKASDKTPLEPDPTSGEQLILYTCWPPDSISHRYLVIGKPVGAPVAVSQ